MAPDPQAVLDWHRAQERDIPWRGRTDPYPILVAEVMSQQTQAERVVPHWRAFLDRFPTVQALAAARQSEVVAAWVGLGYNRRARNLHAAAQLVAVDGWPATAEGLRSLPGVGPYTAAAVASMAFGEEVAAVDTNVRRVLSRWAGRDLGSEARAAATATLVAPASAWNQALMDLGALVCTARSPRCDECPAAAWCGGPVAVAVNRQSRFTGSLRQARGAVVRVLAEGEATLAELRRATGIEAHRLGDAIAGLTTDGMVEGADPYRLAD